MKIYTIVTPHETLAKNKINEALTANQIPHNTKTNYDMQEVAIQEALFDVASASFLVERKATIIKNPYFLTAAKTIGPEHDLDQLTKYLNNPNPENVLIFHAPYEKLDERKKIVKLLKKTSNFVKIEPLNNLQLIDYTKDQLKRQNITFNNDIPQILTQLTKNNIDKLTIELQKLQDYFANSRERNLTAKLIYDLVPVTLEDNIFLLTEALTSKNKKAAYRIFSDLMTQKEEPIKLIVMIANQFRLLGQIQRLQAQRMYEKEIATELAVHPYRVKIAIKQARLFTLAQLDDILKQLAEMDLQIKTGQIDSQTALELFILKI